MSHDTQEVSANDAHARGPLLLLLGSGLVWLVISGVLALIASVQLHTPTFLASCAWFTYGHMQAPASAVKPCAPVTGLRWERCFGISA